ncbi:CLUMA_CG008394, isoform A [Clunio marinus]|uniref:CLUMA_CG008394, isoform A n=1 Tax=Clunio marinus TaxID=568069 RepID=A0A1J1I7H3_9DIPT|nr:CLUMA_CG008394, isoform A [Clunio marinus]
MLKLKKPHSYNIKAENNSKSFYPFQSARKLKSNYSYEDFFMSSGVVCSMNSEVYGSSTQPLIQFLIEIKNHHQSTLPILYCLSL